MGFWTIFKEDNEKDNFRNTLHKELEGALTEKDEDKLTIIACVSGLLAHLAFADLNIEESESIKIKEVLSHDSYFSSVEIDCIHQCALKHAKDFAGLENHMLTKPLTELMEQKERFELLKALFEVAASDGSVSSLESEEVRLISQGLRLSNQHYLAARATVAEHLAALR